MKANSHIAMMLRLSSGGRPRSPAPGLAIGVLHYSKISGFDVPTFAAIYSALTLEGECGAVENVRKYWPSGRM